MGDERETIAFVRARLNDLADATADAQREEDERHPGTERIDTREIGGVEPYWAPGEGMAAAWEWFDRFVAAGRAIVDKCEQVIDDYSATPGLVLSHLAAVWGDHPDYKPEWKPDA